MGRPATMMEGANPIVSSITYNVAGQITALTAPGHSESRTYNIRGQLTRQTGFGVDISYGFSSTQNDGRIQTRTDHVSGETVEYQYDQLGRLISAATQGAGGWGLAWNHDGFGNLTQQSVTKGQMTGFTLGINGATNRVTGQNYDANGNWLGSWGQSQTYDVDNRVHTASSTQHQETYLYSARNERMVSKRDQDRHRVHFYGADGLLLGIYTLEITQQNPSYTYPVRLADQERIYFGGRLMQIGGEWVATDRLGSVVRKGTTNYKYAPYGQEIGGATDNDTVKFATYTRDTASGLDYALNRYYKPEWGRFTSPDPYQASGGPADPGSWNRYTYVGGDPANNHDPNGLLTIVIGGTNLNPSGSSTADWAAPGTEMNSLIAEHFGEEPVIFQWRGQTYERDSAAGSLYNLIMSHTFSDGEQLNIVAHSHGGNVAKLYTWMLGARKIDTLITMGTPQRFDIPIYGPGVGTYLNIYSRHDGTQRWGGMSPYFATIGSIVGGLSFGPVGGLVGGLVGGFSGLAGRTDRCAVNIGIDTASGIGNVGHSDLHSPQVWRRMLTWLTQAGHGLHPSGLSYCGASIGFGGAEFDVVQSMSRIYQNGVPVAP